MEKKEIELTITEDGENVNLCFDKVPEWLCDLLKNVVFEYGE